MITMMDRHEGNILGLCSTKEFLSLVLEIAELKTSLRNHLSISPCPRQLLPFYRLESKADGGSGVVYLAVGGEPGLPDSHMNMF